MEQKKLNHFILGEWRVDVTRSQIASEGKTRTLEPKVMDVLQYLARHQGKVLSQEQIYSAIWPHSIFTPGSLQRCIRLLRIAFGEDAHNAKYIVTHPKRGYSLELPIEYLDDEPVATFPPIHDLTSKPMSIGPTEKIRNFPRWTAKFVLLVAGILLALLVTRYYALPFVQGQPDWKTEFTSVRPITSTSGYEFFSTFSFDGQFLAFIRAEAKGQHHIWVKELKSGIETQLTSTPANYFSLAWHPQKLELLYAQGQVDGDRIGRLKVATPGTETPLLSVVSGFISNLAWSENGDIYYLCQSRHHQSPECRGLYRYDSRRKLTRGVYQTSTERPIEQMAMAKDGTQAVLVSRVDQRLQVSRLDLKSFENQLLNEYGAGTLDVSWHPSSQAIVVNHNGRLELVGLDGKIKPINFNSYLNVYYPGLSPDGQSITLTLSRIDQDLALVSDWQQTPQVIVDSANRDTLARMGKSPEQIIFVSDRSGRSEVFLKSLQNQRRIFDNPHGVEIEGPPVWSADGQRVAFAAGTQVYLYDLNSQKLNAIEAQANLFAVLAWYANEQALLLGYNDDQRLIVRKLNLNTHSETTLAENVMDARLDTQDRLILQYENAIIMDTKKGMETLISSPSPILRFSIHDSTLLYQTEKADGSQLWQLKNNIISLIGDVPTHLHRLQDSNEQGVLFTTAEEFNSQIMLLK